MTDTTEEMAEFQRQMFLKMTPQERFKIGLQMSDEGMRIMKAGILAEKGPLSKEQMTIEIIKRQRLHDPTLKWLDELGLW